MDNYYLATGLDSVIRQIKSPLFFLTPYDHEAVGCDVYFLDLKFYISNKNNIRYAPITIIFYRQNEAFLLPIRQPSMSCHFIISDTPIHKIINDIIMIIKGKNHAQLRNEVLTLDERMVVDLFSRGFSNNYIAKQTKSNYKTVSARKRSAMNKLGVRSNVELFRKYHSWALN